MLSQPMSTRPFVSVTVVTFNSGRFIRRCLESVLEQSHRPLEVIVIDNASTDGTCDILEQFERSCIVVYNEENIGFAAAQNQAIALARGDWILTLNPDVLLLKGFVARLMESAEMDPRAGTLCGKLLLADASFDIEGSQRLDSTGIYFTPMLRHKDRGCLEIHNGHYRQHEYVFGATAAAACYRRTMIDDISVEGEFFDADFFAYREDADVAWRAQLLGWRCIFDPRAAGYHVRKLRPGMRSELPAEINMHSVKNRFLMRIKNITPRLYMRNFLSITLRDAGAVVYCLLIERTSLPAFVFLARNFRKALRKRRIIQARSRSDEAYMASWFRYRPVSVPLGDRTPASPARQERAPARLVRQAR